jgi:hypothetical protein
MNLIQGTVQSFLPSRRKTTSGGWISFNAPCCQHRGENQDKKSRGGIIFEKDGFVYNCFNCGYKAGWVPGKNLSKNAKELMRWLGMPDTEINKLSLEALKEKDAIPVAKKELVFDLQDEDLPDNCISVSEWIAHGCEDSYMLDCIEYIISRGLSLDDYNWHWSPELGYRDRIILPFYYQNRIVGWTGRKINDGKPKYLTKTQAGYVFNLDAQVYERKFVVVVEGQFDAIAIDGVAIMHNEPNEVQCARINGLEKEVIVVPDRDRAGAKLLKSALEHGWSVSLPPWGDHIKDVADAVKEYGKIYVLAAILHYREHNRIKIELMKKKLEKLNVK